MKKNQTTHSSVFIVIIAILFSLNVGCSYGFGIKGNGNVVKQDREIESFNGIEAGGAFKIFLTQGDNESLTVETDENLLDVIKTEVKGNKLVISTTKDIKNSSALNVYISFQLIEDIEISGACQLTSENKLRFDDIEMECSGASDIDIKMIAQNLELDCSGASQIELYGSAVSVKLDLSGASHFDGFELETGKYIADISGASSAKIFVNDELSADVSGAAGLKYKGNPTIISHDVSGAAYMKKH